MSSLLRRFALVMAVTASTALNACGVGNADTPAAEAPEPGPEISGEPLRVFAAASLATTLDEVAQLYTDEHDRPVQFNFAGSADLAAQISQGAPADVLITADQQVMSRLMDSADIVGEPALIASNELVIAVPAGNPQQITGLQDLTRDGLVLVMCAPQVPCGAAAQTAAAAAGVELEPVSEENAVTDVLGKVRAGEADAGLVYRTDTLDSAEVDGVAFPESARALNHYPAAVVADSTLPEAAQDFIDLLQQDPAQTVLQGAGFGPR